MHFPAAITATKKKISFAILKKNIKQQAQIIQAKRRVKICEKKFGKKFLEKKLLEKLLEKFLKEGVSDNSNRVVTSEKSNVRTTGSSGISTPEKSHVISQT